MGTTLAVLLLGAFGAALLLLIFPIPLSFTNEQRAELIGYAARNGGSATFHGIRWQAGENPTLALYETVMVSGGQVSGYGHFTASWDVVRTIQNRRLHTFYTLFVISYNKRPLPPAGGGVLLN